MHRGCFVWTPTLPPSGRRTPCPGPARALFCRVWRAGLRGAFWCSSPIFWPFCPSAFHGPLRAGAAPAWVCFPPSPPPSLSSRSLMPRLSPTFCDFPPWVPLVLAPFICSCPPPLVLFFCLFVCPLFPALLCSASLLSLAVPFSSFRPRVVLRVSPPPLFFSLPPPPASSLCVSCLVLPAVAVFCAACRAVVARRVLMWAAAHCAVSPQAVFGGLCCAVPRRRLPLCVAPRFFVARRSPAEKTQSLLTLRGSSNSGS